MINRMSIIGAVLLTVACGTVVGNPKKPDDGDTPPTAMVQLPLIDFEIPAQAVGDISNLMLSDHRLLQSDQQANVGAQRAVLESWGLRSRRLVRGINRTSQHINTILEKVEPDEDGDYLFVNQGDAKNISAKIRTGDGDYRATICVDGEVVIEMTWVDEEDGAVTLTRDFSAPTRADESPAELTSVVTLTPGEVPKLTIETQGVVQESDDFAGSGFNEYAETQLVGEALHVRMVGDWYQTQPAASEFSGKTYLTGRLFRDGDLGGDRQGQAEFVAFNSARKILCAQGFDEDSDRLWNPEPMGEPRWCLGRPLGRDQFADYDDFLETLGRLEEVGVVKRDNLRPLGLSEDASCDK